MNIQLEVPRAVLKLTRELEDAGFETWAVGGAIRDALRGLPGEAREWDLATKARPEQMQRLFRRTVPIGVEHGTVGVFGCDRVLYEVTTFRRDAVPLGRKAIVSFADTLEEDLARRDFTVNAIAWHPLRGELRDPHGGEVDLRAGVLRSVGVASERFKEDYLRVLRGLRFAGALDLSIDPDTWESLVEAVSGLGLLSAERVREELVKVMEAETPSRALALYQEAGVFNEVAPELGVPLGEGALRSIDSARAARPLSRIGLLLLNGLEAPSVEVATQLLTRLRFSNADILVLTKLVSGGKRPPRGGWPTDSARRRWMGALGRAWTREVIRVWVAGIRGGVVAEGDREGALGEAKRVRRDLASGLPLSTRELPVSGQDLIAAGFSPGPEMGEILRRLLVHVWEDPGAGTREALLHIARGFAKTE